MKSLMKQITPITTMAIKKSRTDHLVKDMATEENQDVKITQKKTNTDRETTASMIQTITQKNTNVIPEVNATSE